MKDISILFLTTLLLTACASNDIADKHLDEKTFTNNDITVRWYKISRITTIHDYIDIERWGHHKNIMEANTGGIYDILINRDTIIIQTTRDLLVYELAAKTLNCQIKLDTSITTYKYVQKNSIQSAEAFKDQSTSDTSVTDINK